MLPRTFTNSRDLTLESELPEADTAGIKAAHVASDLTAEPAAVVGAC